MAEELGVLKISLGLDSADFTTNMSQIDRKLKGLNSEFKAAAAGNKDYEKTLAGLKDRSDMLSKTLTLQKEKVGQLLSEYNKSAEAKGKDARETEALLVKYNNAVAAMNKTESALGKVTGEIQKQSNPWKKAGDSAQDYEKKLSDVTQKMDDVGDKMKNMGDKMSNTGQSLSVGLTAPIVGFGIAAGKMANDFDSAAGIIQAEIGTTGVSAEKLEGIAKSLWKEGFGENIGDVSGKVAGVSKALGDLSKVDLSYVTKGLDLFEKRGWADQQESLRAIKVLMEQYGMSAQEATDYVTKGFQENLDYSGEFLDTISEYTPYFKEMGFTSDEMFAKLKSGAESGAFQLDKVGDSMKEFSVRAKDGSKASTEAFQALGLNAEEMTAQFNKGGDTAKKAFDTVVNALMNTKDETDRNTIATALFGTQYEDLGESAFAAMLTTTDGLKDVEGATQKASDAMRDNFGERAKAVWRELQEDMLPVGETLLDIAEDFLPKAANAIGNVTDAFADMSPKTQEATLMIGGIAAATGPALIALGSVTTGLGSLTQGASKAISAIGGKAGFTSALSLLTTPVGLAIGALGLGTVAFLGIKDAVEKAKEVNLEYADSLINEHTALETSIGKYESLRGKLQLNNEEFALYLDIQDKIKMSTDPAVIDSYKDAMGNLQEKSGLTVDELNEFIKIDADIRKNVPEATQIVSGYGNSFIDLSSDLQPVLDKQREFLHNQLEIEKDKAYETLKQSAKDYLSTQETLNETIETYNRKLKEQAEYRSEAKRIQDEIYEAQSSGDLARAGFLKDEKNSMLEKANLMDSELDSLRDKFTAEQKSLGNLTEEIAKGSKVYDQLVQQEMKIVGINGKSTEAIKLVDGKIKKLNEEKSTLDKIYRNGQITTEEYNKQNGKLGEQIGKLSESRGRISDILGEQKEVTSEIGGQIGKGGELNRILDKDHYKEVDVDDKGGAKKLQKDVEKPGTKKVSVKDNGGASKLHKETTKQADKKVKLSLRNTLASLIPKTVSVAVSLVGRLSGAFAKGTKSAPGGLSLVGEEGAELIYSKQEGLSLASGPSLINLPKGASVIPAGDTRSILNKWNVPANVSPTSPSAAVTGQATISGNATILVQMDSDTIARVVVPMAELMMGSASNQKMIIAGMKP